MSELRDEFNKILLQAFGQVEKALKENPYDEHGMVGEDFYAGKLIAKVKAHIEECKTPNPKHIEKKAWNDDVAYMCICQSIGIEDFRKALMESIEKGAK